MCLKYEKQFPKPETTYKKSPNYSARNGVPIGQIVYHYTTSNNVDGVISWLCNPKAQVSAHYVIDRSGNLYQLVKDADRAWHAYGNNVDSIGIEVCAEGEEAMTPEQSETLKALSLHLLNEYPTIDRVTGHRFLYKDNYTDCPGNIFGRRDIDALRVWISQHILPDFKRVRLPQ